MLSVGARVKVRKHQLSMPSQFPSGIRREYIHTRRLPGIEGEVQRVSAARSGEHTFWYVIHQSNGRVQTAVYREDELRLV